MAEEKRTKLPNKIKTAHCCPLSPHYG